MSVKIASQTAFNGGELTPNLFARTDIKKYNLAVETAMNCTVLPHGPIQRRGGSLFIKETAVSANVTRLIPFVFAPSDSICLEFGNQVVRFYKNRAILGAPYTVVTPYLSTELAALQFAQLGNDMYLVHPSYEPRILHRVTDTSWTLSTLDAYPVPTVEIGFLPVATLTVPATTGAGLTFTTSAAVFLAGDVGRQIVSLQGQGRAAITAVGGASTVTASIVETFPSTASITSGNWKLDLSPIASLTPSAAAEGSIITLTSSTNIWRSTDVGRYVVIQGGIVKITVFTSTIVVSGEVQKGLTAITATSNWELRDPAWSSTRGYPSAVSFYQQRLVFGGTTAQPKDIWMSEPGLYDRFSTGAGDADGINVTITKGNRIQWLGEGKELIVGTGNAEITVSGGSSPLTASNIQQIGRSGYGSNVQSVFKVGDEVLFTSKSSLKLRSFLYDFTSDTYKGDDLTFFADHITESGIKELAYTQDPYSLIYAVLNNGTMAVCAYERGQEVLGWTKWDTQGKFESVAVVPNGEQDDVYVVVKRTLPSGTIKRYVEVFIKQTGLAFTDGFSDSYSYSIGGAAFGPAPGIQLPYLYSITQEYTGTHRTIFSFITAHGLTTGDSITMPSAPVTPAQVSANAGISIEQVNLLSGLTFPITVINSLAFSIGTNIIAQDPLYGGFGFINFVSSTVFVTKVVAPAPLSGLTHLEGYIAQVKVDGGVHPPITITSGVVTINIPASVVVVGLSYTTTIKTLPLAYDIGIGSMVGQQTRLVRPLLRVRSSTVPLLSDNFLPSRHTTDHMNTAVPLFTGLLKYGPSAWTDTQQIEITVNDPLPLTLLGISGTIEGNVK